MGGEKSEQILQLFSGLFFFFLFETDSSASQAVF